MTGSTSRHPGPRIWHIVRAAALDLLDVAIAVTAWALAGAIAFAGFGVLPLYLPYLTALTTGLDNPGRPADTNGFAASLTGVVAHAILVVAFLGALIVAWRVTTAVARALPQRGVLHL
ncbi:MAG: hypothetical protein JWR37_3394, partial [Mycobacterium sp.]|nr:hypothetical protein [Mycobacterium sp.]